MVARTVVAWDGSAKADEALRWGVARERQLGQTIHIVRVVDESNTTLVSSFGGRDHLVDAAFDTVAEKAHEVRRAHPELTVSTDVVFGSPVEELRKFAAADSVLVVGTDKRSVSKRQQRWSVGSRLASSPRGPVAMIPRHVQGERSGVVVGVTGSEESTRAAFFAAAEASRWSEELHVVLVWSEPPVEGVRGLNPEFTRWLRVAHEELLEEILLPVRQSYPAVTIRAHLENDSPVPALQRYAHTSSLLIVGSRRRGSIGRLLLGSVGHALVLGIECPIIVLGP
ncbi:MAG TPA: universal stress protein [Glaciihabitans sp.]|jgi:nucleotide-binding universal stress UspA family protein|nr:universal stress protein [Glaciihabitans sp.]